MPSLEQTKSIHITHTTTDATAATAITSNISPIQVSAVQNTREADVQSARAISCASSISSSSQPTCNSTGHLGLNDNGLSIEPTQFLTGKLEDNDYYAFIH
jgi:hypothetical protein